MKILIALSAICFIAATLLPQRAGAQIVKTITVVKDSTVNTDNTTLAIPVDNDVTAVEIHLTKVSGTVAGTATFQGSIDGTNWETIGTLTLADAAVNFKTFPLSGLYYAKYRIYVSGTGTNKIKPIKAYVLRRT